MNDENPRDEPEFGPAGYLPQRAARRARKIVLRGELGLQWVIAAVVAALVLLVAGWLLLRSPEGPPAGFVAVAPTAAVSPTAATDELFAVRSAGRIRVFGRVAPTLQLCEPTGHLEALVDGRARVWSVTGRPLDGGAPLTAHPVAIVEGVVYADPDATVPTPAGADQDVSATCVTSS